MSEVQFLFLIKFGHLDPKLWFLKENTAFYKCYFVYMKNYLNN